MLQAIAFVIEQREERAACLRPERDAPCALSILKLSTTGEGFYEWRIRKAERNFVWEGGLLL